MTGMARDRLRTENDLREAEEQIGRERGVSVDEAAQALKDRADILRVAVVDVARAVIAGEADMGPMRLVCQPRPAAHAEGPAS